MLLTIFKSVIAASVLASTLVSARKDFHDALSPLPGISYKVPKPTHQKTSAHKITKTNYQRLHPIKADGTNSRSVAAILGTHQRAVGDGSYQNITSVNAYGTQYAVDILFGETQMQVYLDTGSSDTWVVQEDYECVDFSGVLQVTGTCAFGPAYPGDFQYGDIPGQHIYILYGDGEMVYGPVGYSDITIGGITVNRQEVALANRTYWYGNNVTSGVLGLAYPSLTNAYLGNGMEHNWLDEVAYSPVFTTMVSNGLIAPYFSIAINRNSSGGLIGWGGIPPISGLDWSNTAATDIIITNLVDNPFTSWQYSFYTMIPDGFQWDGTKNHDKFPMIVDSGTTLIYLPPPLAEAINGAFVPAAVYVWMYGAYFTACDAKAPIFSVLIQGSRFFINSVDLIYRKMVDPLTGLCMTAIASGGAGPYILGDVFLQNVLAIFDVGASRMEFISRPYY